MTLNEIINQLKECKYVCEAGPLENNKAFIELEKKANKIVNIVELNNDLVASVSYENVICHNDYKVIIGEE